MHHDLGKEQDTHTPTHRDDLVTQVEDSIYKARRQIGPADTLI